MIIVICAILALSFIILNPKPPPVVSNPTTQNQSSQCFEIPTSPSKIQVLSFINLTKNGSECALAALREYQSANILTSYNISINLTSLAKNITTSSVNQNYTNNSVASSSCIMIPSNPTKAQVLSFIKNCNLAIFSELYIQNLQVCVSDNIAMYSRYKYIPSYDK